MYSDGYSCQPRPPVLGTSWSKSHRLLTGGQPLTRLHPLHEGGLGIADGAANADVRRPVPAHARLREPGEANLQKFRRFLRGEERPSGEERCRVEVQLIHWRVSQRSLRILWRDRIAAARNRFARDALAML